MSELDHSDRLTRVRSLLTGPTAVALAVLSLLWVIFFWRLWTPDQADRVIFEKGDFPLHYFSYSDFQAERIAQGDIPLWNPYNYGGDPFAANVQWVVWYPPRWVALLLAGPGNWDIEAYQFEVAAHYWLVSLMMYAFLRALTRRPLPALVGSILYAYGGYMAGYPMLQPSIIEAIIWLPLMMLGAHLSLTRDRWRVYGILLSAAGMAISFFGGHTQTTMQMTYFTGAYIVYMGWRRGLSWRGIVGRVALLGIVGGALAAVQLLPAYELVRLSYRTESYHYADKSTGFTASEFVQFLWPGLFYSLWWPLYLGVAGLLLALGSLLRLGRDQAFWLGATILSLWLAFGGHSIVYDVFYVFVPGFDFFREQERAAALAVFSLIVLATGQFVWLLDRREQPPDRDERRFMWLARGHLLLTGGAWLVVLIARLAQDEGSLRGTTTDTLGLVAFISLLFNGWLLWRQRDHSMAVPAALIGLIVVDLFTFGVKSPNFVPDTPENRIQPPDFYDILSQDVEDIQWHVDGGAGLQTYGTYWRIPDIYGTGPFKLASLEKLRGIRVDARWEVFAVRYATMSGDVPDNVPLEALGTGVNYDGQEYTLYELTDPRPFAHLVYGAHVVEGDEAARAVMNLDWADLRHMAVLTEPPPFELPNQPPDTSSVSAFKMVMPEYMEMSVTTSAPAILTLPVAIYPGWRATVNGQQVDILDTYAGLIGIPIQPGENQKVTLELKPASVLIGAILSLVAWIGVSGYVGVSLAFSRRRLLSRSGESGY